MAIVNKGFQRHHNDQRGCGHDRAPRRHPGYLIMYSMTATLSGLYGDHFAHRQSLRMIADIHEDIVTDQDAALIEEGMAMPPVRRLQKPDDAERQRIPGHHTHQLAAIRMHQVRWNTPNIGTVSNGSAASRRAERTSRPRPCTTICRRNCGVTPSAHMMVAASERLHDRRTQ